MTSWKTTLCGILAASGTAVAATETLDPVTRKIGGVVAVIATALLGVFAKDHSATPPAAKP